MSAGLRTTADELASLILETSRSFLWNHEKNGHKNTPWILGRTDGENTYDFWSSKPSKSPVKSRVSWIGGST